MGCKGGVCVICSTTVGKNGAGAHYGSHGYAWYCSCGFSILSRDGCRAHARRHAPRGMVIHAVSPGNEESLAKKLGVKVAEYLELSAGAMSVAEAAYREKVYPDFVTFKVSMIDDEFLLFYRNKDIRKLSDGDHRRLVAVEAGGRGRSSKRPVARKRPAVEDMKSKTAERPECKDRSAEYCIPRKEESRSSSHEEHPSSKHSDRRTEEEKSRRSDHSRDSKKPSAESSNQCEQPIRAPVPTTDKEHY